MSVAVISGRFPLTKFDSAINHKVYADHFGYDYIHCNWPTKAKNPYLNKIYYILQYIEKYDYIIWIDDDAFFMDLEKSIMDYAPEGDSFISLCQSPDFKSLKTYFSSGQFIIKSNSTSIQFLKDILNQSLSEIKAWWTKDLGYFSNGDQDIMIYLLLTNNIYKNRFTRYNYKKFNSRYENLNQLDIHKPLILHFTGTPQIKQTNYNKIQLLLDVHTSLLSYNHLKEYHISRPSKKTLLKKIKQVLKKVLK